MSNPITAPDSSLEHPMPVTSTINQLSAPVGVTLQRFIANEQRNYPQAKGTSPSYLPTYLWPPRSSTAISTELD